MQLEPVAWPSRIESSQSQQRRYQYIRYMIASVVVTHHPPSLPFISTLLSLLPERRTEPCSWCQIIWADINFYGFLHCLLSRHSSTIWAHLPACFIHWIESKIKLWSNQDGWQIDTVVLPWDVWINPISSMDIFLCQWETRTTVRRSVQQVKSRKIKWWWNKRGLKQNI